jgi:hypothetical protein
MNQVTYNLVDDKYNEARKYGNDPFTIPSKCRFRPLEYMAQCLRAYGTDMEDGTVNIFVGIGVVDEQLSSLVKLIVKGMDDISDQMYRIANGGIVGVDAYLNTGEALSTLSHTMLKFYSEFQAQSYTFRDNRGAIMWQGTAVLLHRMHVRMDLMAHRLKNHKITEKAKADRDGTLSPGPSWIERHPNTPRVEYIEDGT